MKDRDYEMILASLERAIAVFEAQGSRVAFDQESYEKLKEIAARVENARKDAARAGQ